MFGPPALVGPSAGELNGYSIKESKNSLGEKMLVLAVGLSLNLFNGSSFQVSAGRGCGEQQWPSLHFKIIYSGVREVIGIGVWVWKQNDQLGICFNQPNHRWVL